jgi:hypothetical protein
VLELSLKYELYRRDEPIPFKLSRIILRCGEISVLSETFVAKANSVNTRRNDVIHAKIQTDRPESLLDHTGEEHEIEPIEDLSKIISGDGLLMGDEETNLTSFGGGRGSYSRIYYFKKAARSNMFEVREILEFLYPVKS